LLFNLELRILIVLYNLGAVVLNNALLEKNPTCLSKQQGLPVYASSNKIYPKRMAGPFRKLKWWTASLWLIFFIGPYLRWQGQQAILLDIPARKFYFFELTIYPQDVWILTFVLLFFAMLLVLLTIVAGRVFCGYFCFQTVWTDVFMWLEERFEGATYQRKNLDQASWSVNKVVRKLSKHTSWLIISALTGLSFAAWFTDAYQLWIDYFSLQVDQSAWIVLALFTMGTYILAGFMREQVCFWLCPYARIQATMYEKNTILPTYDLPRGEPRKQYKSANNEKNQGDCVDCDLCVAVCPTGIDIRDGQQIGCISCGLCIDACDHVMKKLDRPVGLIRYTSWNNLVSGLDKPLYKIPMVVISATLILVAVFSTLYGINTISDLSVSVRHYRQPEFLQLSNSEIRNRYQLKIQNKSNNKASYQLSIMGLNGFEKLSKQSFIVNAGQSSTQMISIDVSRQDIWHQLSNIIFHIEENNGTSVSFKTVFMGPLK
jgi:cytochrome c oxidase accessory protein FixG